MRQHLLTAITLSMSISPDLFAMSPELLKKYPNQVLTNDYGILSEAALKRYADNMSAGPFNWQINGADYWQCFATSDVSVWYEKREYDPDEKIIRGIPHVTVEISPNVVTDYEPRRAFSLDYAKEKVEVWEALMKNESHVCMGGMFAGTHEKIEKGEKVTEYGWVFENLKTKKGCDSYFSGWCG